MTYPFLNFNDEITYPFLNFNGQPLKFRNG